ncbi:TIGR03943 family protein [Spiractinospora alimapuensis]|nr:TIGR03943 family protein [Spiractinospora alimapuensis]QVQ54584.1 TIGR03943 family protein [Spiractinospora alimapuensis]
MNRMAQGLLLVLVGVATLSVTLVGDQYVNYVKPFFFWMLMPSGVVLVLLGGGLVFAELRAARAEDRAALGAVPAGGATPAGHDHDPEGDDGHGHSHDHAPRSAWLLLLPVVVVFVVAPPALGSYSVSTTAGGGAPPEAEESGYAGVSDLPDDANTPHEMSVQEFVMHAWMDEDRELEGQLVRLTGFAVPPEGDDVGEGWYLARLQMACCAADAIVNKVLITNEPEPDPDTWFTVEGYWNPPDGELSDVSVHQFEVETIEDVDSPPDPYE